MATDLADVIGLVPFTTLRSHFVAIGTALESYHAIQSVAYVSLFGIESLRTLQNRIYAGI